MKTRFIIATLLALVCVPGIGHAADPRYPDWPCVQAKVPEVSLAAVWAGPDLGDATDKWKEDMAVSALVERLAARRTPLDEAEKALNEFLAGAGDRKLDKGRRLFAGLFETLNAQRSSVLNGLERVTRKQRGAADAIRAATLSMHSLQDQASPDPAKIEQLSNQLLWQTRIFEDRQRVIKFVCEVPVAIDQRLFALGRAIQQAME
ncbi:hypothetical protein FNL55_08275 [Tardiphaga sp. vice352]|uniref:hypothetical protein n=1 Tax=unclassified Tardiphaga TaxID=2631404 RepID=UPI0011631518|nr:MULTISPECIES: hypothetical protein [unclassified Tardiphaga]MBC7584747.1 hypothetical protein [Tardiphaga sp.]QDM15946.1 hypothetical protein FNL53_08550 [Tardiphaga sp. vice278]QDM21046.1 hypothetical protein FIU28_07910 [Tardiphaga sp. vice154]QDM26143.1 hypothetical protein FNL56_08630 [Tardiphaga sp. vice304]QDM31289.1 hypothetical protein FNL55_08275 [Tardiphaga sp. vice352]